MRFRPVSRALIAGTLLLAPRLAPADIIYETDYLSSGSVVVPTSSLVSTSYLMPTSYSSFVTPTSYSSFVTPTAYSSYVTPTAYTSYSSSYLTPTSAVVAADSYYYPTSYVRSYRSSIFRPRRYVERTSYYVAPRYALTPTSYAVPTSSYVLPTSYYVPTSYLSPTIVPTSYLMDSSLVATSMASSPCDESPAPPITTSRALPAPRASTAAPVPAPAQTERQPSGAMQSTPSTEAAEPGVAEPPIAPVGSKPTVRQTQPAPVNPATPLDSGPVDGGVSPPAPTPSPAPLEVPSPGNIAPRSSQNEGTSGTQTRETLRPVYSTPSQPQVRLPVQARNVLRGRVLSFNDGKPEEGVTVYLTSRTGAFTDRSTQTDADGHFAVTLPDGDWSVRVRMPSGNVRNVGGDDLTASSGRVTDPAGRGVQEFVITR